MTVLLFRFIKLAYKLKQVKKFVIITFNVSFCQIPLKIADLTHAIQC